MLRRVAVRGHTPELTGLCLAKIAEKRQGDSSLRRGKTN